MILALDFLLALLVSATLVPIFRIGAVRLGYLGTPHESQTPPAMFGGVAIALTLFICSAGVGVSSAVPVLLACSAALFLYGVGSDLFRLKPYTKVIAQIAVACVFLFFDYRLHWTESVTLDNLLTLFWIVGVISAFNLLDNMDGLCAGIGLIAGAGCLLTVLPLVPGSSILANVQYLVILLGAIAGFLIYNVHPASVVMGDSGSLLIGLNMAAITLQFAPGRGSNLLSVVAVPLFLLLIPIVDAMLMAVSRFRMGVSKGMEQEDSAHRLVAIGLSERAAVGLLWLLAGVSGLIAVAADRGQQGVTGVVAAIFTVGMALFGVYLARVQVHEHVDPNRLPGTITPLGGEFGYRRRLAEVLLDLLLVSLAYYGAYRLRYEGAEWAANFSYFQASFPLVIGLQMLALFSVGAYRGMWRYFSLSDGVIFGKGVIVGAATSQVALWYLLRFEGYSAAIFIVYSMLLLLLLTGSRASFRLLSEFAQRQRRAGRRLVIYGASDAGSIAIRQLMSDHQNPYRIVGFVDDDMRKRNARVHGYPVIGGYDHLVGMIMAGDVDAVCLTGESSEMSGLAGLCAQHGVTLHRIRLDWREIPAAAAGNMGLPMAEARVVQFTDARRERAAATVTGYSNIEDRNTHALAARVPAAMPPEQIVAPIRVVHIITRLILGGAQENTIYTAIGQHRDPRFDVTILCGVDEAGEGNMFAEVNRAGVRTVVLPSLVREVRPFTDLKAVFDVYRFLKAGSYTIVHTHSSKAGIIGRLAARAARVPVIVHTLHGLVFHEFQSAWKNRVYIALKRICAPMTDKIVSVSDRVSETALASGIGKREQHITIYSGIELDLFLSVRDRLTVEEAKSRVGIPSGAPVVGKIARLFPLKGHEQFLAAAVEIARQVPDVYFLLVGDGPLRDHLRAEAARLGIGDRVVMVGRVPPEKVPEYIQAMDVVVHTSLREGIARVLPQAGAVGKPVVTFDLDGAPEVIRDGVSGYLVRAVDIHGIAERAVDLLGDSECRRVFGEAGRAFAARHFSVEGMVERVNTVYLELLASVPANRR